MNTRIQIRQMEHEDVDVIYQALQDHEIGKPLEYINWCWEENQAGNRVTLMALYDQTFAGWLHLLNQSGYPPFREAGIPEINNFDVLPTVRRLGIGNALMDAVEQLAFKNHRTVGIGVGLYYDYGNAQRIYAKRGYIPDGRGISFEGKQVKPGSFVQVGHDLALHLTKERP